MSIFALGLLLEFKLIYLNDWADVDSPPQIIRWTTRHVKDIDMDFNDVLKLKENGFIGFETINALWYSKSCIPKKKGVYLVLDNIGTPDFINPGVGGFFKGKNPNVSIDILIANYVPNSLIIYIGKAGGPTSKATLHSRLTQYLRFGQGKNVGHWGGRLIWQLKHHKDLILCWKPTPDNDPREIEKSLLSKYITQFGKKPFANLVN